MIKGDLFYDFCSCLGIKNLDKLSIPQNKTLNSSLDQEQIQFLTLFNKFVPTIEDQKPNPHRGQVVDFLEAFSNDNKLDISYQEKQKIYEYFEADNNKIAARYINNGQPLFDLIKPSDEKRKPIRLSAEKAVEIAAYLWVKQQEQINRNNGWYTKTKKSLKKIFRL